MLEAPIRSTFVSQVAALGFADAVDRADHLTGEEIVAGRARLEIQERIGDGLAGAVWYSGLLRTGAATRPLRVDVVVSPWPAGRTEIGLRPLGRLGFTDSLRARRFFSAAWSVLPVLIDRLAAGRRTEVPAPAPVGVAA